jgi:hypothetical protein
MSWFTTSNRLWDSGGVVAYDNPGVAIAKSLTYRHNPYTTVGSGLYGRTIEFNFHFIKNLRRVLSGVTGDTRFSVSEQKVYTRYIEWVNDESVILDISEIYVLEELDKWLMDEVQCKEHLKMLRSYTKENQWK